MIDRAASRLTHPFFQCLENFREVIEGGFGKPDPLRVEHDVRPGIALAQAATFGYAHDTLPSPVLDFIFELGLYGGVVALATGFPSATAGSNANEDVASVGGFLSFHGFLYECQR